MAATAEFIPEVFEGERYCGSLYAEHEWYGFMALKAAGIEIEQVKMDAVIENAFDDHMTSLTENMVTDEDYVEELVFGTPKVRKIIDGRVVSKTGRSVCDVVETGARYSRNLAESDPVFKHQADRDQGDLEFMEVVDSLEVGEVAHAVSMDPKSWYETHPKLCDSIGYREGMAIQHVAYKSREDTMLMWTYAIKQSDPRAIAQIYREDFNVDIPVNTNPDLWIQHIQKAKMPQAWVEQIGARTLEKHRQLTGSKIRHYSIDEFMADNVEEIKEVFDTYLPRIAISINTKKNDPELQALAQNILGAAGENLKLEIRQKLLHIANSPAFDDDSGRLMKVMIRYATLEKLRTKIPAYKERIDKRVNAKGIFITPQTKTTEYLFIPRVVYIREQNIQELSKLMAQNIGVGVSAKRSVGGCSGISISGGEKADLSSPYNDIYSRADNDISGDLVAEESDAFGPLKFKCPKGHWNKRPRAKSSKDFLSNCKSCNSSLKCVT